MTIEQFANQPIEEIVKNMGFISAQTDNRNSSLYWEIIMKAILREDGYYFLDKKVPHETCVIYKLIQL